MLKRLCTLPAIVLPLALTLVLASPAAASPLWNGDTSGGTGVFGTLDCDAPAHTGVVFDDEHGHGDVWKFDKPSGSPRCEARNIRVGGSAYQFRNDSTYYLGWSSAVSTTTGAFVTFQWKSYPNGSQNYPVLMEVKNGDVRLFHVAPGGTWNLIWSAPVTVWLYNDFALGIHTSDTATGGWIELYFNGTRQTFSNGSTRYTGRTWDGDNEPKWGAYDSDDPASAEINYVDGLKAGTSYADVAP
ncbi:hypothetical protein ABZS93_23575 [Streptomyces sp900116325]|uniref:hypothetical protein n=1 Tax=Streptomyces sp. 900116325 TaxID=3154295 RepID=UPI0033BB59C4